jgi:hypothetical protein
LLALVFLNNEEIFDAIVAGAAFVEVTISVTLEPICALESATGALLAVGVPFGFFVSNESKDLFPNAVEVEGAGPTAFAYGTGVGFALIDSPSKHSHQKEL